MLNQLKSIDITKSCGSDGLSARFLKLSAHIIAPILTTIFNNSILNNTFPKSFKNAKVIPIHKKGSKSDKRNYRPISILPLISLILERHVSSHLKQYLEKNQLLYQRQSGFRSNHSCQTALIRIIDDWITAIDKNEIVGSIFLDLSKAFDYVDHSIIIEKLRMYNLDPSSVAWFSSYLDCRTQQTYISGLYSESSSVTTGVPQGSVLGPILFLIYINDLPLSMEKTETDIFADDTTLSTSDVSLNRVVESLTHDLLNANKWCDLNRMSINVNKTKVMYISSKHKQNYIHESNPCILYKTEQIFCSSEEKLLGITINNTLSWQSHIDNVLKKCNSLLHLLSRIKLFISIPVRKMFYNAYILPHLDYCCIIYGNCTSFLEDKLIKFQKRAARLILDKDYDTPSAELFSELRWMTFSQRVVFQKAIMMFKIMNNQAPSYLLNNFILSSDVHTRILRSSSDFQLYTPRPNTEQFRKSFVYSGSCIWNGLPDYIKSATSVNHFKTLYLRFYHALMYTN